MLEISLLNSPLALERSIDSKPPGPLTASQIQNLPSYVSLGFRQQQIYLCNTNSFLECARTLMFTAGEVDCLTLACIYHYKIANSRGFAGLGNFQNTQKGQKIEWFK